MNPGPETGLNARKFGFKARTKYGVYKYLYTLDCMANQLSLFNTIFTLDCIAQHQHQ